MARFSASISQLNHVRDNNATTNVINFSSLITDVITIAERLKDAREAAGLTQEQLATRAGVSQGTIANVESGMRKNPRELMAIAKATKVNAEWLKSGKGPRALTDSNVATAQIGARRIPLIDYVQAGVWTAVTDSFQPGDAEDWLLTDLDLSSSAFALQIKGESMQPDFAMGDRVIIDPNVQPQAGDFVVAKNGDEEATFKKYRVRGTDQAGNVIFELVPINPDFETMRSDERLMSIVGVMVEHRKYRRKR